MLYLAMADCIAIGAVGTHKHVCRFLPHHTANNVLYKCLHERGLKTLKLFIRTHLRATERHLLYEITQFVTCHPTQVNAFHLNPNQAGR